MLSSWYSFINVVWNSSMSSSLGGIRTLSSWMHSLCGLTTNIRAVFKLKLKKNYTDWMIQKYIIYDVKTEIRAVCFLSLAFKIFYCECDCESTNVNLSPYPCLWNTPNIRGIIKPLIQLIFNYFCQALF